MSHADFECASRIPETCTTSVLRISHKFDWNTVTAFGVISNCWQLRGIKQLKKILSYKEGKKKEEVGRTSVSLVQN